MLRLTRGKRYLITDIRPSQYKTVTDGGGKPADVRCTFLGPWRDVVEVGSPISALFEIDGGGNIAIPLRSLDQYNITPIEPIQEPALCR